MTIKIKIFGDSTINGLESKVNKFLESLNVVTVKDIKYQYSPPTEDYPDSWHTVLIIYSNTLNGE